MFRALHATKAVDLTVYYAFLPDPHAQGEGFGVLFTWDIPLRDGYRWAVAQVGVKRNVPHMGSLRRVVASTDIVLVTGWHAMFVRRAALSARIAGRPVLVRGDANALRSRRLPVRALHRIYLRLFSAFIA